MISKEYKNKVDLLARILPLLNNFNFFALKGGTAINFFYQNRPRLSVDIDLAYTPINKREEAINEINNGLNELKEKVDNLGLKGIIKQTKDKDIRKLLCHNKETEIIIEPNYTIRGSLFPINKISCCHEIENEYGRIKINVLPKEEVYAGKFCASLDRGHPRDLFDIKELYKRENITEDMVKCFIVYALCGNKAIDKMFLSSPKVNINNIDSVLENKFYGMSDIPFTKEDYIEILNKLKKDLYKRILPYSDFIINFFSLKDYSKITPFKDLEKFPAFRWKEINLRKLKDIDIKTFEKQAESIKSFLGRERDENTPQQGIGTPIL